jgi:quaternary ammonium compound-resistance protein SugE
MAQTPGKTLTGVGFAILCMGISGWLLWLAQRQIAMGTAYAVWTGIGAAGAFFTGILLYGDPAGVMRFLGVALIVGGFFVLKLAH